MCEKFYKQCQRKNHEDNHIPNGYYLKKIGGTFDDKYIEYKSEVYVKPSTKKYLVNIRPYLYVAWRHLRNGKMDNLSEDENESFVLKRQ